MRSVTLRLFSLAILPAVLVSGCADAPGGSPGSSSSSDVPANNAAFDKITVTPGANATTPPTVQLAEKPVRSKGSHTRVIKEGTGEQIGDKAWLDVHHARYSGADGKLIGSSYAGRPTSLKVGEEGVVEVFNKAVKGQKIGAQVLAAVPASKMINDAQLPEGMSLDDSLIFVIDVVAARPVLERATGTPVPPKPGIPAAEVPDDLKQPAKITVPSPQATKDKIVQPLITGSGKKVEKGQVVRFRYTGVTWRDPGKPFDYSGNHDPNYVDFPVGEGNLIKAWDNAIPGHTVGSRLLIVAQPEDAYGDKGEPKANIKPDDVLIFVLDILDAYDA
ncbi:FKBP-type peptidyl-prolyl cis-trans isomerase [Austwickia chelonae]|uniref:peptidylprolyl isomerase n=1 Tax=Austwickia chelonae NBRC 105200 TaxID=1184607 RepID=K6VKA9_9MICO|nr:FKBP-type peptidyl-prolyl cis-trans isomerase [Austwickia chelonae]GAB77159.1 putative peptidyl-prolyl cis-trans isomerase FKBP-type [Austwickia chelonae NBRC 105200]SEW04121.1 FKBP-type peptidyl-prolyl cis-trans isomerase [Austwickia chelonae]